MNGPMTRALLAVGLALAVAFALMCAISAEPVQALRQLLTGALPEPHWSADTGWTLRRLTRFGAVIEKTITLTLLGLAVMFGFRARQFSIGADGQFFLSALAAVAVSVWLPPLGGLELLLAGAAAVAVGFVWGLLPGLLKAEFDANEIVTTLMLNVVAVQAFRYIVTHGFNDPAAGFLVTPTVPAGATLAAIVPRTQISAFVLAVPLATLAAAWLLRRTTLGYEIRVVGDAPAFARQAGLPVKRAVALSMALGGAFAGLAGLHASNALLHRLPADLQPGIGFEGLVVALLARNQPAAVPVAALLYAFLEAGAQAMERSTDVSREMVLVIQALIVLFVVAERLWPAGWVRRKAAI